MFVKESFFLLILIFGLNVDNQTDRNAIKSRIQDLIFSSHKKFYLRSSIIVL